MTFEGAAPFSSYALTNARAYDVGAGIYVSDRSGGWGLGSRAFVLAGIGRISSDLGDGRRYFAEGGGGLTSGPLGVDLSVKFAWSKPAAQSGRAPIFRGADHHSGYGALSLAFSVEREMPNSIDDWLAAACADAERRGLPELKPLLEALARSTAALRAADESHRSSARPSSPKEPE